MPEISVIIPCYGQAHFLGYAIGSVQDQSFADWECIIVNDASPDNTSAIAETTIRKDKRFRLVQLPENQGLAGARNAGIREAKGKFILPLDADDKIAPNYIQQAVGVFARYPDTVLIYAKAAFFGNESGEWELPPYHYGLLFGRNPIYCSAIYRRADWEKTGGYDSSLKRGLEDWDFWLKMLGPDSKVVKLDETGFFYRKHGQTMINELTADQQAYEQIKGDMLMRYRGKWLSWSFNYLAPALEQIQFQSRRETKLAANPVSRWLYRLARRIAKA